MAKKRVRPYLNFFSSNSAQKLNRDRLAENWWMQVWFHIGEMLTPDAFNEWCNCLAEDQRAKVKVGTACWKLMPPGLCKMIEEAQGHVFAGAPWEHESVPWVVDHINW